MVDDPIERVAEALSPFFCAAEKSYGEHRMAARVAVAALMGPLPERVMRAGRMHEKFPGGGAITQWASNRWDQMICALLTEDKDI